MNKNELVRQCQTSIARGSKTFTFASRFFPREKMQDAALLYQWCRHCDDAIDACPADQKRERIAELRMKTEDAIRGVADETSFRALAYLLRKHSIPAHYPRELIEGMAMDAEFRPPVDLHELKLYCYRVAGVVGLMMAHVMGVSDVKALRHACDLGMAMQLTNISRDILDDFRMGRRYLPDELLRDYGLDANNFALPEKRSELARACSRLLDLAEDYYRSGEAGTPFLSRPSALVILIARFTYGRIGDKVRSADAAAWDTRQYTTVFEKWICLGKALRLWIFQLFAHKRFKMAPLSEIWRFQ